MTIVISVGVLNKGNDLFSCYCVVQLKISIKNPLIGYLFSFPRLSQGDSVCERVFTVNDVSHGGCKYGIMNFSSGSRGSLSVEMCDNLYFTNRKVVGHS